MNEIAQKSSGTLASPVPFAMPSSAEAVATESRGSGATPAALTPGVEEIRSWLIAKLVESTEVSADEINIHESFAHYGLGSVDAVGLSGDLEDWLERSLSPTVLYDYPTIDELARHLAGEATVTLVVPLPETHGQKDLSEPVAIVGIGCRFPGHAHSPDEFWRLLQEGTLAVSEVPAERWNIQSYYDPDPDVPGKMYTRHGAFVEDIGKFDAAFFGISPREAVRMDPQQRMLAEVTWEALEHAGVPASALAGSKTGMFVGMMSNFEYAHLQMLQEDGAQFDDPYFGMGTSSSVAAGRLAYLLDLQGPTMTVDTACSSSLVCVHLASQSLRNGECDLALVGGVNAVLLAENIVNACKMRMLSQDGKCKTFDASADGFVLGEGCGVVVLKRLSDALQEKKPILAVIRGSAVNQDGQSNGLTAPNRLAQAAVIRQALRVAQVEPRDVSYVEAHGSGTSLGDPIEIGALTDVLYEGRSADDPLIVGSVKTNIGHLAGAAGIAGLIKTVLALHHQEIPAHLNVQELNPHIAHLPHQVLIPQHSLPWKPVQGSRIAGVSSFGWSGTNAHVVLEEASTELRSASSVNPWQVLTFSAKTADALEAVQAQLLAYIKEGPAVNFADLAYSSQVGRSTLAYRRAIVAQDTGDALRVLESGDVQRISVDTYQGRNPDLTFLFPGLGDHSPDMGLQLYQSEPVFRQAVDECAELLQPLLQRDIRDLIYPNLARKHAEDYSAYTGDGGYARSEKIDLRQMLRRDTSHEPGATQELYQTQFAHPALFVVEYALARLWLSWGVRPQAMIGYSLGEYVAVCLSGVLSLPDVLRLVALRARMIQGLPAGSMMAVALPEEQVLPLLGAELSLAAVNGPRMCVVGGPTEAVLDLERLLLAQDIACQRLQTTHAFHTALMSPLIEPLTELVASLQLHVPLIPFLSNVTGTWITPEQVLDPGYWARHMCETVRLADSLDALWHSSATVLLEVGPGQFLSSLALQHPASQEAAHKLVLRSLRHPYERCTERELLLSSVAKLWAAGGTINWAAMHAHEERQVLRLPTYPFERRRYWIGKRQEAIQRPARRTEEKLANVADWLYVPVWKRSRPLTPSLATARLTSEANWLIFADNSGLADQLARRLQAQGQAVTLVKEGEAFLRQEEAVYTIHPALLADYEALLKHLKSINRVPEYVIHMWNMTVEHQAQLAGADLSRTQLMSYDSLLSLAQALGNLYPAPEAVALHILSHGLHEVVGGDLAFPEQALLLGPAKVIPREYPYLRCRSIDLPYTGTLSQERMAQQLIVEFANDSAEDVVAYRDKHRWVQSFEAVHLNTQEQVAPLVPSGVYLITGGLGGLGSALAEYLARTVQARLVLVGRTPLPEREQWADWLAEHDEQDAISQKLRRIQKLEQLGSQVLFSSANVAHLSEMQQLMARTHETFGPINGVIHAAGNPGQGLIQLKTPGASDEVLTPKVQGTVVLDQVLQEEPLDFLVLYSSSNSVIGGFGEVDYCSANAFLDAFAHYKTASVSYPVISINWGPWQWDSWQEKTFAVFPEAYARIKAFRERYGISFAEGEEAWRRIFSAPAPQYMVLPQGFQAAVEHMDSLASLSFLTDSETSQATKSLDVRPQLRTPYVAPRNEREEKMATIWQEALGIEEVGIHDHFFELGGNSLIGLVLISRIKKLFDVQISAATLFEGPTISLLLDIIYPSQDESLTLETSSSRGKQRRERLKRQRRGL